MIVMVSGLEKYMSLINNKLIFIGCLQFLCSSLDNLVLVKYLSLEYYNNILELVMQKVF